jgi:hypothetical protein
VNPSDTANRLNDTLARRLAQGGTNADQVSSQAAPSSLLPRLPTLSGVQ